MFKKSIITFLVFLSLLFNIQLGFTHDVEHINHEHHESSLECEDCLLKQNLVESTDLTSDFYNDNLNDSNLNDNYDLSDSFTYIFVAYQSNAP